MLHDQVGKLIVNGHIRIFQQDRPENVVFEDKNVIVLTVKSLFARLCANNTEPSFGIWGLAIGSGNPSWPPDAQPDATATQTALFSEILRKQCSFIRFVDADLNPVIGYSEKVDFQTILNATLDNIGTPLREMGLIGGGTTTVMPSTNMSTANYWDPDVRDPDSVTLINYKTLPPLALPPGINFIVSWVLSF